jgi:hypothetical protein
VPRAAAALALGADVWVLALAPLPACGATTNDKQLQRNVRVRVRGTRAAREA